MNERKLKLTCGYVCGQYAYEVSRETFNISESRSGKVIFAVRVKNEKIEKKKVSKRKKFGFEFPYKRKECTDC